MSEIKSTKGKVTTTNNSKRYSDEDRNTSVHIAAAYGNIEELKNDIQVSSKIDAENYLGWTPLMMAARNGHLDIVKLLIENKADASKKNHFGSSVFLMAVANGNVKIIEFILQHLLSGGVSRQIIECRLSPICMSILFKHDNIVQYLIAKGFNVNSANILTSITPLMYSAVMKNMNIFNHLIANGANLYAQNINQHSAQDIMALLEHYKLQYLQHWAQEQQKKQQQNQQQKQQQRQQKQQQEQQQQQHQQQRQQQQHQQQQQQQQQQQVLQYAQHSQIISPQVISHMPINKPSDLNGQTGKLFSPQPTFLNLPPVHPCIVRKSSNFLSPHFIMSPCMSPINQPTPQMFFPPDFHPQPYLSLANYYYPTESSVFEQNIVISPNTYVDTNY